jgi:hypothetical protein
LKNNAIEMDTPYFLLSKLEAVAISAEPMLEHLHRLQHTRIKKMAQIDSVDN